MIDLKELDIQDEDLLFLYEHLKDNYVTIVRIYNNGRREEDTGLIRKRNNEFLFFENGSLNGLNRGRSWIREIHVKNEQVEKKALKLLKFKNLFNNKS
jgi:hypothetical protein